MLTPPTMPCPVVQHHGDVEDTASRIRKLHLPIRGCMVGCESGVEVSDQLCEALGLQGNGNNLSQARRNKYLMGERIRACGLRAAKQLLATNWEEVEEFIASFNQRRFRVVLKPVDSAGTDSVFFADSMAEARTAFGTILGGSTVFGQVRETLPYMPFLLICCCCLQQGMRCG